MKIIARIHTDFQTKFGIPRQSGLVDELKGTIVFEPAYRNVDAVRGLEGFSHIWLLWNFSESEVELWSPTVRPPRLGGNLRVGVFATRSPFRPNPIGLSSVKLEKIESHTDLGPVLHISGADMMNGTPIYDIKPYLRSVDCHPDATGGFTDEHKKRELRVVIPDEWMDKIPEEKRKAVVKVLALDPRPSYQNDPERVYGITFAGIDIRFKVAECKLTVYETVEK